MKEREKFWSDRQKNGYEGQSAPEPYEEVLWPFIARDVLEIGPGMGRQTKKLAPKSSDYSLADISQWVLDQPVFKKYDKHHIDSYQADFGRVWETIHFWYVIHHVKRDELKLFLMFLGRHLAEGGVVYFNVPSPKAKGSKEGDGMHTTLFTREELLQAFIHAGFRQEPAPSGCLLLGLS